MRNKIVEIAQKEIGYKEGKNNDTKYGNWYGLPNQPWCAMFISWCANRSGIPTNIIPKFASCTQGFKLFSNRTTQKIVPQKRRFNLF